jgi:hypothetical protein
MILDRAESVFPSVYTREPFTALAGEDATSLSTVNAKLELGSPSSVIGRLRTKERRTRAPPPL